jgi:hypothetical protein
MNAAIQALERLVRPSAVEALRVLVDHRRKFPGLDWRRRLDAVRSLNSACANLDYAAGRELLELLPDDSGEEFRNALRALIQRIVLVNCDPYRMHLVRGPKAFVDSVSENVVAVLSNCGLLDDPPSDDVITWWDYLTERARADLNLDRVDTGRQGERLSLEWEVQRLSSLGMTMTPKWIAAQDSYAGFDIESYDPGPFGPLTRYIEVKSCSGNSASVYVTRNEWRQAQIAPERYWFHVWRLEDESLVEVPASAMADHIAADRGNGLWQVLKVTVDWSSITLD